MDADHRDSQEHSTNELKELVVVEYQRPILILLVTTNRCSRKYCIEERKLMWSRYSSTAYRCVLWHVARGRHYRKRRLVEDEGVQARELSRHVKCVSYLRSRFICQYHHAMPPNASLSMLFMSCPS